MAPDRFVYDDALIRYRSLSQRVIHVHVPAFKPVMNLIDSMGWRATMTNVSVFSPNLVREFLANHRRSVSDYHNRGKSDF